MADKAVTSAEIEEVIRSACKQNVRSVRLFDVYVGDQIGADKKSMAYTVVFGSEEKQLSQEDVDGFVKRILSALKHRIDVDLR